MLPAKSPQKHCSEEQLLAFLDGELRPDARRGAQDHLSRCWQCRGRMADLESRAHDMAELLADFAFLGHSRIAAAKEKFLASVKKSSPANDAGQSFSRLILLGSNPLCGRRPPWGSWPETKVFYSNVLNAMFGQAVDSKRLTAMDGLGWISGGRRGR